MKKLLLLTLISLFAFSFSAEAQNKKKTVNKNAEVTFAIEIHCSSCVKKLENTIPYIKGIKDMKINAKENTLFVKYDASKTSKDAIKAEIEKLGMECVELVEGAENPYHKHDGCC